MNTLIIAVYFLVMILIGLAGARKIKHMNGYCVADRSASTALVTGSLVATIIGGSSTLGLAGLAYAKGLVGAWWLLAGALGLLVLGCTVARRVRSYGVYTLPGIIAVQYGGTFPRVVASVVIATAWLGVIAAQIVAAGKICSVLWPESLTFLMIVSTVVFVFYTVLGGQYSVLRTDGIQALIIIGGVVLSLAAALPASGGLAGLPPEYFSFPTSPAFGWMDLAGFIVFVGAAYVVGPDIYSRLLCARNGETARKSVLFAAAAVAVLAFGIALAGMAARVLLPGIPPESALPALAVKVLPPGLNGLVIAALLAAVMSSADTCLLTTGVIISSDVIQTCAGGRMGNATTLAVSRVAVVAAGAGALLFALWMQGVIASLLLAYTVYSAGLVVPVLFGFYRERFRLNTWGVVAAMVTGGAAALLMKLGGHDRLLFLSPALAACALFAGSGLKRWVR